MEHEVEVLPHVVLVEDVLPEPAVDVAVEPRAEDPTNEAPRLGVFLRGRKGRGLAIGYQNPGMRGGSGDEAPLHQALGLRVPAPPQTSDSETGFKSQPSTSNLWSEKKLSWKLQTRPQCELNAKFQRWQSVRRATEDAPDAWGGHLDLLAGVAELGEGVDDDTEDDVQETHDDHHEIHGVEYDPTPRPRDRGMVRR